MGKNIIPLLSRDRVNNRERLYRDEHPIQALTRWKLDTVAKLEIINLIRGDSQLRGHHRDSSGKPGIVLTKSWKCFRIIQSLSRGRLTALHTDLA